MKRLLILLPILLFAAGCATTSVPKVEQIPVPVPFCPAPPDYLSKLPKDGGIDAITEKTAPGDVAKLWHYEVEYLRGLADVQAAIIEAYKKNNADLQLLEKDINRLIDETNKKLKETQVPTP